MVRNTSSKLKRSKSRKIKPQVNEDDDLKWINDFQGFQAPLENSLFNISQGISSRPKNETVELDEYLKQNMFKKQNSQMNFQPNSGHRIPLKSQSGVTSHSNRQSISAIK